MKKNGFNILAVPFMDKLILCNFCYPNVLPPNNTVKINSHACIKDLTNNINKKSRPLGFGSLYLLDFALQAV